MNLIPLPAFQDNYLWLLHDGQRALVVDPGDADPVRTFLAEHGLQLEAILVTHHHADHTGGVDALRQETGARVFGPARERVPEPLERLAEGDRIEVLGLRFDYWTSRATPPATSPTTARTSKARRCCSAATPCSPAAAARVRGQPGPDVRLAREAGGPAGPHPGVLHARIHAVKPEICHSCRVWKCPAEPLPQQCEDRRSRGEPTLPSTIALEHGVNPFLRTGQPAVARAAREHSGADEQTRSRSSRPCANGRTSSDDEVPTARPHRHAGPGRLRHHVRAGLPEAGVAAEPAPQAKPARSR